MTNDGDDDAATRLRALAEEQAAKGRWAEYLAYVTSHKRQRPDLLADLAARLAT
jgi:hypothetical protein